MREAGRYYLLFSGGSWEGEGYGVSFATAPHPLGPWNHDASPMADVLSSAITGLPGPGHNSLLREDDGTMRIAYHAWDAGLTARRMFIDDLLLGGTADDRRAFSDAAPATQEPDNERDHKEHQPEDREPNQTFDRKAEKGEDSPYDEQNDD